MSLFEKEEYEDAVGEFTKAIGIAPHSYHFNNRGLAYYHMGLYDEALSDYNEAIKRQAEDALTFYNRGNVYLNKGQYELAHNDYDQAITKEPKNSKFWHAKGLAYQTQAELNPKCIDQGMQEKAIDMFKQSLSISDHYIGSRFHLGLMCHKLNRFDKALKYFSGVIMKTPQDKTTYIARGLVYQDMGNHQFAINDFNHALAIEPKYAEAFFRRGIS